MAIGADGIIYLTNGKYGESKLFSFNPDLTLRWSEDYGVTVIEGPSIAYDGTMIVCAGNYLFKAYEAENPPQLIAEFEVDSATGNVPLTVHFKDKSVGINSTITTWEWDFDNDGVVDSYDQNPVYEFQQSGSYTVSLKIGNGVLEDTIIKEDYIQVFPNTDILSLNYLKPVIYPNPAKDFIHIAIPDQKLKRELISVFDMTGKYVLKTFYVEDAEKITVDVSTIEPGLYFMRFYYAGGIEFTEKVMIK